MKRYSPIVILALFAFVFATTGFQCGSAEMTTARLAMQQGQFDKAEASLLKELEKNDKNEEAWFDLGRARWAMRKYHLANDAFDRALSLSPTHAPDIWRTRTELWGQKINEGVNSYNSGSRAARTPDSTAFANQALASALEDFQLATEVIPDSAYGHLLVGVAKRSLKDREGAEQAFKKALSVRRGYKDAYGKLEDLYLDQADEHRLAKNRSAELAEIRKLKSLYEDARLTYPDEPYYLTKLIAAHQELGEDDAALTLINQAVQKEPNSREYAFAYGDYLFKKGDFEQSIVQFKKCVGIKDSMDAMFIDATENLGISYLNWGVTLRDEARRKAEDSAKSGKKGIEDQSYIEKFKTALPFLERAGELNPSKAESWERLGKLYTELNMTEKADIAFKKFDALRKGN